MPTDSEAFDVIAVGGGFSGLMTSCRAAQLGLKAAVLEQRPEPLYPCSSRYSTGVFGVMGMSLMNPPRDALRRHHGAAPTGPRSRDLAAAVAQNARRAYDVAAGRKARASRPRPISAPA